MYQRSKIYKIEPVYDGDEGDVYIGSTTVKHLNSRISKHISSYKRWKEEKHNNVSVYKLFDKYGIDDCEITLLEKYPCDSKEELRAREGYHIKSMNCINMIVAGRTREKYCKDNKENKAKYDKKYRENNIKKIYRRRKDYRENNKDKIKTCKSQKHVCICGSTCRRDDKARHERTQKHLKYIADHADTSDSDSESDDE